MTIRIHRPNTFRITVLPGQTFRGTQHFHPCDYDASPNLAKYAVDQGLAKWPVSEPDDERERRLNAG